MKLLASFLLLCLTLSCNMRQSSHSENSLSSDTIRYAQGFSVHHFDDYTAVEVHDPWDSTRLLQRYLLVDRDRPVPGNLPKGTVVQVPAQNIVVYTSVHAAIIDQLGETRYMDTPSIQEGLKAGRIADMGEATAPNVEMMIDKGAELVIVSPFQNSGYGPVEKLGIPIIEGADYMESLPLGRTEWIRFYGMLFMPAGDSYIANMYADAGADYVFKELPGAGSTPLAFETVLDRAIHADMWLIKYNQSEDMTYGDLRAEYAPYENFDAFKNRRIYSCNTGLVPYYEEFPLHPDYLLKDLIWVFHPELLPGYSPRYYRKMQD